MRSTTRTSRWLALGAILTAVGLSVGAPDPVSVVRALPSVTGVTLESTPGDPEDAVGGSRPSVSEDGRLVAFVGAPAGRKDPRATTAYLRDRESETLVQLTPRTDGVRVGETARAIVSADGCSVTVVTQLPLDLFLDDDLGDRWDVYRAALPECASASAHDGLDWELVSTNDDGSASNIVDADAGVGVSSTGTVIAFVTPAGRKSELLKVRVADLTERAGDIDRVRDVPGLPFERPTSGSTYIGQTDPAVSGDGTRIAFTSDALAHLADPDWSEVRRAGDAPETQVYLWNRTDDTVTLVSTLPGSTEVSRGSAAQPSLSDDGLTVAFSSTSRVIVAARYPACPAVGCTITQVFVSRLDGNDDGTADDPRLTLVSRRPEQDDTKALVAGNATSSQPSLSADGSMVAFVSRSTDLLPGTSKPGDIAADGDIIVADVAAASLRRASVRPDTATPAFGANTAPALSATGRVVTFETGAAAQIVPGAPADGSRQVVSATFPVSLSIPSLDVGTVPPKWPSAQWFVSVTNTGASSFVPDNITVSDDRFAITGGSCFGASVPPGGSCTVKVVFTPTGKGDVTATLTLSEQGFGAAHVTGVLAGSGGEPFLSASPAGVEFDRTVVGRTTDARTITVSNTGFSAAVIDTVRLTGPNPDDFSISNSTCPGTSLAPSGNCTIDVTFDPTADGARSALVTITTDTGSRTSVVVGGAGFYRPSVAADAEVRAGERLAVTGSGFAPETALVISWADGTGRQTTVVTNSNGDFLASLMLGARDRSGARELMVSDPSNVMPTVRTTVMVRPGRR